MKLIWMPYLQNCKLPIRESSWVCENDMAVIRVFPTVLHGDSDIQQFINAHFDL